MLEVEARRGPLRGHVGRWPAGGPVALTAVAGGASGLAVAYVVAGGHPVWALVLAALPLLAWELGHVVVTPILLGASIPAVQLVVGGTRLHISLADLLLLFIAAAIVFRASASASLPALPALRPIAFPVVQYVAAMLLLLAVHPGRVELTETTQRLMILILPLLVGAFVALQGSHVRVLKAYVLSATLLAAVRPFDDLGLHQNPAGQMIAAAIIVLAGVRTLRPLLPCLAVLVPGLFLTGSRGSIAAAAIGIAVIVLFSGGRAASIAARVAAVAVLAAVTFAYLPSALHERLTTLQPSTTTAPGYSLYIREQYDREARRLIAENPWTGVGVGGYLDAVRNRPGRAEDPHQVLLLQAAEGGYGFAASFVLLIGGAALALWRMRRLDLAVAAAAVVVATAAHGLVDIYWVRGTPVVGWLLVGMACGAFLRRMANERRS